MLALTLRDPPSSPKPRFSAPHKEELKTIAPEDFYSRIGWRVEDLNCIDASGLTKAAFASKIGNVAVLNDLIARGSDLLKRSSQGRSPLHLAVQGGQEATVKCLLGTTVGKALAGGTTETGLTPLMLAAEPCVPLCITEALLPYTEVFCRDQDGLQFEDHARKHSRIDILMLLALQATASTHDGDMVEGELDSLDGRVVAEAFQSFTQDLPRWINRLEIDEVGKFVTCWENLLAAHRHTILMPHLHAEKTRDAITKMSALRSTLLQRDPQQKSFSASLSPEVQKTVYHIKREQQRLFDMCEALDGVDKANMVYPLAVSAVPTHLRLIVLRHRVESGQISCATVSALLLTTCEEGQAILAQRRALQDSQEDEGDPPPSLNDLKHQFEQLRDEGCFASETLGLPDTPHGPVQAVLEVIATVESSSRLNPYDESMLCSRLQAMYLSLISEHSKPS